MYEESIPIVKEFIWIMRQKKELRGRGLSEFSKPLFEFRRPRCFFLTHIKPIDIESIWFYHI